MSENPANASTPTQNRNQQLWIVLALVVVAALLRFWDIGGESFWYDELIMVDITQNWELAARDIDAGRGPVLVVIGYAWGQIFGYSEASVRAISAIAGTATILFLYLLARRLFDQRVAMIAAGLAAISGFLIYYSQDYRYYSLVALFNVLSYYFFVLALQEKRWYFIPYVIFSVLLYHTHPYALYFYVGQGLFFLLFALRFRDRWVTWFLSQLAIIAGIWGHFSRFVLPGIIGSDSAEAVSPPDWLATVPNNTPLHTFVKFIAYNEIYLRVLPIVIAAAILVIVTLAFIVMRRGEWVGSIGESLREVGNLFTKKTFAIVLLLMWIVGTMIIPFILHEVMQPMYRHRYVIGGSLPFFILLAAGLVAIRRTIPLLASVGALVAFMLIGLVAFYREPVNEQWRTIFADIAQAEDANDQIVVVIPDYNPVSLEPVDKAIQLYYSGDLERCALYEEVITEEAYAEDNATQRDELRDCLAGTDRVWVVLREYELASGQARATELTNYLSDITGETYTLADHRIYYGVQLLELVPAEAE
ncbi:MAG: glycosyltransferase family 39 protein [Anaerolineae bacterium]|nr:glycosyltransferase family 39 protein [Anaerolineae bacterium]